MGLEWFGLPKHKTLRPLCVVLFMSLWNFCVRESLCCNVHALTFIGLRGVRTLSGVSTGGPATY
jgi:hypothetical protein